MNIKVDVRETALIKILNTNLEMITNFKDIKLIQEQLPLGDIIINDGEKDLIIIVKSFYKEKMK